MKKVQINDKILIISEMTKKNSVGSRLSPTDLTKKKVVNDKYFFLAQVISIKNLLLTFWTFNSLVSKMTEICYFEKFRKYFLFAKKYVSTLILGYKK